jgi:peptidoglycan/xylan/chitin deacetylase (PgdA/CDA1 family)
LNTGNKVIALTFDGGSDGQGAASIMATLSREKVPATFFLTGAFATENPSTSAALAKLGTIGNHTSSHPHLPQLSADGVRQEVTSARTAILRATGRDPLPRFRFPFGDYDARTLKMVNDMGYAAVGWTVDTLGWKGASAGVSVATITARVAQNRAPGEIVLMHIGATPDGSTLDADALPTIIAQARSAGYTFVSITAP